MTMVARLFQRGRDYHPPTYAQLGLAMIGIVHGVAYTVTQIPPTLASIPQPPSWLYALLWFVSGALVLIASIFDRTGILGVAGMVTMCLYFAGLYQVGQVLQNIEGVPSRLFIFAGIYFGIALYVMGTAPHRHHVIGAVDDSHAA